VKETDYWKEEFILYPDSRVVKTGTGRISVKREIIVLPKILRKYISYNFWVAPLEFSSHKGMKSIVDIKNVKETDYVIKTYKNTHLFTTKP
jgi:hypothetical protein